MTSSAIAFDATERLSLNGDWSARRIGDAADAARSVPGVWDTGLHVDEEFRCARTIQIPEALRGRNGFLRFGAVDYRCEVDWDGNRIGCHTGYFEPFWLEAGKLGREHTVGLQIFNPWEDRDNVWSGAIPKVNLKGVDNIAWGHNLAGIWKPTELIAGDVFIHRLGFRQLSGDGAGRVELKIVCSEEMLGRTLEFKAELAPLKGNSAGTVERKSFELTERETGIGVDIRIENPELWSPDRSALYRLSVSLLDAGKVIDTKERQVGFKDLRVVKRQVVFNGEPFFFRGLADYGSIRAMVGLGSDKHFGQKTGPDIYYDLDSVASVDRCERFFRLLKGAGCNIVRVPHFVAPEEFYEAADRAGVCIYNDFPLHQRHDIEKLSPEWTLEQFESFMWDMASHPAVAIVACSNEFIGVPEEAGTELLAEMLTFSKQWAPGILRMANSGAEGRATWVWPNKIKIDPNDKIAYDHRLQRQDVCADGKEMDDDVADYHRYIYTDGTPRPIRGAVEYLSAVWDKAELENTEKVFFLSEFAAKTPAKLAWVLDGIDDLREGKGVEQGRDALGKAWDAAFGDTIGFEEMMRSRKPARAIVSGRLIQEQILETRRRWMSGAGGCTVWFAHSLMKDLDTPSDTFESVQQAYAPIAVYARTFGEGQKRKLKVWVISDKAYGETRIEVSGFDSRNIFLDHPGVYEETYEIGNSPRRFHIQAMHGNIQSASFDLGSGFENEEPRPAAKGSR